MNKTFSTDKSTSKINVNKWQWNLSGLSADDKRLFGFWLPDSSVAVVIVDLCGLEMGLTVVDEREFDVLFAFFCKIVFELSPISFVLQKRKDIWNQNKNSKKKRRNFFFVKSSFSWNLVTFFLVIL